MATAAVSVELGFVEKCPPWKLRSKYFVSKVGGCPAWLRLNNLPKRPDMLCKTCGNPLIFLLQVYAPILEINSAFHRTIFLFMCKNGKCYKRSDNRTFIVYRSQLPRSNEFYSFEPPDYSEKSSSDPSAENYQADIAAAGNQFLLPEYELVTETEELPFVGPEKSDDEKMKEFRQFMQSAQAPKDMQDMPLDDLDAVMKKNDKTFNKFRKRIEIEPEQVLRYHKGQTPLWVSAEHLPSPKDIPNCACGAKREFEFQIMPQLLNHLSLDNVQDSIDWGTLAVYTCSKSCERGAEGYVEEFLWKQDFSDDHR